jgi:Domain of unknown function (DUF4288)
MNWYLAKIVYQIESRENSTSGQFDEQLRLISAFDEEAAFLKAQTVGKEEETCFENTRQQTIRWTFINVAELYRLSELIDGAELYSMIRDDEHPDHYIDIVNKKAAHICQKTTHQLLQLL